MRNRMVCIFLIFFAFGTIAVKFHLTEIHRFHHTDAIFPAESNVELPFNKDMVDSIRNEFESAAVLFFCTLLFLTGQRLPIWYYVRLFIFLAPAHYQSTFVRFSLRMV